MIRPPRVHAHHRLDGRTQGGITEILDALNSVPDKIAVAIAAQGSGTK